MRLAGGHNAKAVACIRNQTLAAVDLLTRLYLHHHIWTITMQLGQPQPRLSNPPLPPNQLGVWGSTVSGVQGGASTENEFAALSSCENQATGGNHVDNHVEYSCGVFTWSNHVEYSCGVRVRFEPECTGTPFRSFSAYSCKI